MLSPCPSSPKLKLYYPLAQPQMTKCRGLQRRELLRYYPVPSELFYPFLLGSKKSLLMWERGALRQGPSPKPQGLARVSRWFLLESRGQWEAPKIHHYEYRASAIPVEIHYLRPSEAELFPGPPRGMRRIGEEAEGASAT